MTEFIEILADPEAVATAGEDQEYVEVSVQHDVAVEALDATDFIEILEYAPGSSGGGGSAPFVFTQSTPAASWNITHNKGTFPDVVLFLSTDLTERVYTDISYSDNNSLIVIWPSPVAGVAYIVS